MRENMGLFRGKALHQPDKGKWIEGNLIHRTEQWGDPVDEYYIVKPGEFYYDMYDAEQVDPSTIGECSGIPDKTGRLIFEGDLIGNPYNVVEYCSGSWCVNGDTPLDIYAKYHEIVGNIHDNPNQQEE